MMYQTEISQQQPTTQFGLIMDKVHQIAQIPKTIEQHVQKRFPVSPCMEQTKQEQETIPSWEKRCEKEQLMRQIKDLVGQVQDMFVGHEEQQYVKTEQEDLLRQIRKIQGQIQDMNLESRPYGWEKKQECETVRKISDLPSRIQDMINGEQKKQEERTYVREQKTTQYQYETTPVELFGEPVKCEQWGRQVFGERQRQLINKLVQQTRVLEEMLVEQQYETVYQMPKIEQLHFHLERELFEQIKKRFSELEEQFFVCGYEQEVEQKTRKLFVLLKKQIKQIEEIIYPGFEVRMHLKTKEQIHREQCQQLLEKIRTLKGLFQEVSYMTCPEYNTWEPRHETETTFSVEPLTKFYNLISLPFFFDEEEIFGKQQTRHLETEKIVALRKELEEIKSAKRDLEMRLYETDKKVELFKRQIELLEKYPKYEQPKQQQQQQIRGEMIQYTKPEEELIKICLKPTQQSTYPTGESKTEMHRPRGFGKYVEQKQQPITKYF